jgi:hypothetical protein
MKIYVLILFIFMAHMMPWNLFAQKGELTGIVKDEKTGEGLPFANVFISKTTLGTVTDIKGAYTLKNIPAGAQELVCSFVGYQTFIKKLEINPGEPGKLNITLRPDVAVLREVEVSSKRDKAWERKLVYFKKVFLGDDELGRDCKILNPWVIDFDEKQVDGKVVFTAKSARFIEIDNFALGYHVSYFLNNLEATDDYYLINGQSRFTELKTINPGTAKKWIANRANAFSGSSRHLFKSIVKGSSTKEGFQVYVSKNKIFASYDPTRYFTKQIGANVFPVATERIVSPGPYEGTYYINFNSPLIEVHYLGKTAEPNTYPDVVNPVSWIEIKNNPVLVNEEGIPLNTNFLIYSGAMSSSRIGSLLANDFIPEKYSPIQTQVQAAKDKLRNPRVGSSNYMANSQERVYVHTNKAYYYPGETIWFATYLNCRHPTARDSMSRVVYVELINSEGKIEASRALFVENGSGAGDFMLSNKEGDYLVRAYTQWMLNYPSSTIFTKPIKVIAPYKIPISDPEVTIEQGSLQLSITPDKSSYGLRDKITLSMKLTSEGGQPTGPPSLKYF